VCTLQIAYADIDELERVVGILAHGDLAAESARALTETNFARIFRLAQLALEYLLHVQDVLSAERRQLLASECAPCCARPCRFARCSLRHSSASRRERLAIAVACQLLEYRAP
jgi:Iguana/Dzip1-like DAZ-interacting protein N-terminal